MPSTLNFALFGAGGVAATHAHCLANTPGARLAVVCNRDVAKAEKLAAQYGASSSSDFNEVMGRSDIQAVVLATPSGTHADFGLQAARAGKHVLVEKPLDISLEKAAALIGACRAAKVKLACAFQRRFDPDIVHLKNAIDSGGLGRLNFGGAHTKWFRPQEYYADSRWRGTWALDGGGALINQSIHYVDLLCHLMGPVEEVFGYCATRGHAGIEVEDMAVATVKFASGALGLLEGSTAYYPGFGTRLDIFGSDGGVVVVDDKVSQWKLKAEYPPPPMTEEGSGSSSGPVPTHFSHARLIADFVEAIQLDRDPMIHGEEAIKSLRVVLAVYESARTGRAVRL